MLANSGSILENEPRSGAEQWSFVRRRLRAELGDDIFSSWFDSMQLEGIENDEVRLSVATRFLCGQIRLYEGRLEELWRDENPTIQKVTVLHRNGLHKHRTQELPMVQPVASVAAPRVPPVLPKRPVPESSPLDPRFTLERFVAGPPNVLAFAYARQVVEWSSQSLAVHQPMFFFGGPGLGKTHLLQGIAQACYKNEARYLGPHTLASELSRLQTAIDLKQWVGGAKVFLFDNLENFRGSKSTFLWFYHLLQALIGTGWPVVMASACPPAMLEQFDERTRSLLHTSAQVEFGDWDESFRLRFLTAQVLSDPDRFPLGYLPEEVLAYMASIEGQGSRKLLVALTHLAVHAAVRSDPLTVEAAQRLLDGVLLAPHQKKVRIEDILWVIAKHYLVSRQDLLSSRRTADIVRPRQIAMYLAKTLTQRSLPEIGRRFGGRDHTTVLHAVRKIEGLMEGSSVVRGELKLLEKKIRERSTHQ